MTAATIAPSIQITSSAPQTFWKLIIATAAVFILVMAASAQPTSSEHPGDPHARVIEGVSNTTVFGMGQSIRITGTVKEGAIAFGGDVIVEGSVDGDVAAIGGSVVQRENARIGGDVIVLGGIYHHGKAAPDRDPKSVTIMYAGYEDQLRQVMRDPFSLLHPQLTPAFLGLRLLAILFWFIVSLALTAVMPNTVSRAAARLNLARVRVALIGLLGSIVITVGVIACLLVLPEVIGALISILALLLVLVAVARRRRSSVRLRRGHQRMRHSRKYALRSAKNCRKAGVARIPACHPRIVGVPRGPARAQTGTD